MSIATELRRLGKANKLIVRAQAPQANRDPALIKAIARAHVWFEMLKAGKFDSITDLARSERLPRTYVSSLLPLALLSPLITQTILDGHQPIDLTLDELLASPLLMTWAEQGIGLRRNRASTLP